VKRCVRPASEPEQPAWRSDRPHRRAGHRTGNAHSLGERKTRTALSKGMPLAPDSGAARRQRGDAPTASDGSVGRKHVQEGPYLYL